MDNDNSSNEFNNFSQSNPSNNVPSDNAQEQKTNSKRKRYLLPCLSSLVVLVAVIIGVYFLVRMNADDTSTDETSKLDTSQIAKSKEVIAVSGVGTQEINLTAGKTVVMFDSGEKVYLNDYSFGIPYPTLLARDQSASNYGRDYQIKPNSSLKVQYDGIEYIITTKSCNTAKHFFDDYYDTVTTDCDIKIESKKSAVRQVEISADVVIGQEEKGGGFKQEYFRINQDPFIDIHQNAIVLRKTNPNNQANSSVVRIPIMTYYGGDTIEFTDEELLTLTSRSIEISPLHITLSPTNLTCESSFPVCDEQDVFTEVAFKIDVSTNRND
ncbi:MAG: hypothetical protein LBK50_03140 [Candidatus Nomurabacteria bacterium]|jgi:hypothetical protein|nr:hypothetical protein [Candidatus Nomurabacteria bacterium]